MKGTGATTLTVYRRCVPTSLVPRDGKLVGTLAGPQADVAGERGSTVRHLEEPASVRHGHLLFFSFLFNYPSANLSIPQENQVDGQITQDFVWIVQVPAVEHVAVLVLSDYAGAESGV